MIFFFYDCLPFCKKKTVKKGYSDTKSLKKSPQNIKFFAKNHNCLRHERVLKIFLLSYFEYHQFWLNVLMDDHHLSNIAKYYFLKKFNLVDPWIL
jgi:hypothetical protein